MIESAGVEKKQLDDPIDVKILLVEDDEGHAELIQHNLKSAGVQNKIVHFDDGSEVINFLQSAESADSRVKYLMILDLNMPKVDGLEVLRRMKSNDATRGIPIVILTTTSEGGSIESCYEYGCNIFITKPVNYEAFCAAIRELGALLKTAKLSGSRKQDQVAVYY